MTHIRSAGNGLIYKGLLELSNGSISGDGKARNVNRLFTSMIWQVCLSILLLGAFQVAAYHPYVAQATEYKSSYETHENPHPFNFGYEVLDEYGNKQQRQENGDEHGNVKGSYGYTDAHGVYRQVDYIADGLGFRAVVKSNEPGLSNEDPANVHITAKDPPQHVIEQSYTGGAKSSAIGSYSEPKIYLKPKTLSNTLSSSYSLSASDSTYKPTYREPHSPSTYIPVVVKPYEGAATYQAAKGTRYGGYY